ncbi:MAG TPA: tetratricopeptide repeat protein, partial [Candidatus Brocadiia bacterium]|nr:tetratricopeptide repeat protein [Candidatus Brocadiia bacterium]
WSKDRWHAFLGACNILVLYGRLLLLPFGLTLEHVPPTGQELPPLRAALAVAAVAAALAAAAWAWRRHRPAGFAAVWFGVWIAPVCHLVPIANPMAERFLYAPLAGFALLAGLVFAPFLRRPWPGAKLLALFVVCLAALTIQRVPDWRNDRTISLAAVRVDPRKASRSLDNLGDVTRELTGREKIRTADARAENLFRRAIVADPENSNAWNNLGILAGQLRQYDKAAPLLQKALSLAETAPNYPWTPSSIHHQLGVVLWNLNRRDEAVKHFEEAVRIWPENQKAQRDLVTARQALERKKQGPKP